MPIDTTTTNLQDIDFSQRPDKAALRGQSLAYHRAMRANFSSLDLTGTNFTGANLEGARFEGAVLDRANFTDAVVTLAQIQQAKSSEEAILPTGDKPADAAAMPGFAEQEAQYQSQLKKLQAQLEEQRLQLESMREAARLKKPEGAKAG